MPKCSFCGVEYKNPRGMTFVKTDGNIKYLCSSKCRKNLLLGRVPKKTSWVRKKDKKAIQLDPKSE